MRSQEVEVPKGKGSSSRGKRAQVEARGKGAQVEARERTGSLLEARERTGSLGRRERDSSKRGKGA